MLASLKRRVNIKYFMAAYVGFLLAFSAVMTRHATRFLAGIAVVVLYAAFDLAVTRLWRHAWYLPVSSWISGFIISVVAVHDPSPPVIVLLPLLAVLSKQFIHLGKARHVFNPAAFAMVVLGAAMPSVSWWAVTWGMPALVVVSAAGIFILWRQERWHTVLAFFASSATSLLAISLFHGATPLSLVKAVPNLYINGTMVFFASVMLIEPMTSSFGGRRRQVIYGVLAGLFTTGAVILASRLSALRLDPLLTGLLLANLMASLIFLPAEKRRGPVRGAAAGAAVNT